ncbi:NAD(P)H-binding protein [Lentzea flava]|nr:NAD(P)H-binding protein [Lentzea flava]
MDGHRELSVGGSGHANILPFRNHCGYSSTVIMVTTDWVGMIGITGASGALGRATAEVVLRSVEPREVVLVTRRPAALDELAALGAHVRHADFDEPHTVKAAFAGVERLLLISTDNVGSRLDQHRAAIDAAVVAGVSYVAYTSVPAPVTDNPAVVVADHALTERALVESGLAWTMLRNHLYAHLQLQGIQNAAATGKLFTNIGDGAAAFVTRDDCAAAAAAVLTRRGHENTALEISGPEAVGARQLVDLAQEIRGDSVELVHVDDEDLAAGLLAAGLPEPAVQLVTSFGAATRGGFLEHVTTAVRDLTRREPARFADVVRALSAV